MLVKDRNLIMESDEEDMLRNKPRKVNVKKGIRGRTSVSGN